MTTTEATRASAPVPISPPDPAPLQKQGNDLMATARATKVTDEPSFQRAAEILKDAKALSKSIEDAFAGPKKAAHEAHKKITALETALLAPLKNVEQILKTAIGGWQMEEARKRREEEAKLALEAQKRREDEQLEAAAQLEAAGEHEMAEAVVAAPVPVPVVSLPKPKAEGVSTAMVTTFRVLDPSKVKREFLLVDEAKIRKLVQAIGKDAEALVGEGAIVVEQSAQVRVR